MLIWAAAAPLLAQSALAQELAKKPRAQAPCRPKIKQGSTHHLELALAQAYTRTLAPSRNRRGDRVHQNGGASYLGRFRWRSNYFLWPQVSSGYVPLFRGDARQADNSAGPYKSVNHSYAVPVLMGLTAPVWRLRLSADIGASWLATNIALNNERTRAESWLLTYRAHIAANLLETRNIRLAAFTQALIISEADTHALSFGFEAASDILSW